MKKAAYAIIILLLTACLLTGCTKIIYVPMPTAEPGTEATEIVPDTTGSEPAPGVTGDNGDPAATDPAATEGPGKSDNSATGTPVSDTTAEPSSTESSTDVPTQAPTSEFTEAPTSAPTPTSVPDGVTDFGVTVAGKDAETSMGVFKLSSGGTYYVTGKADPGAEVQIYVNAPGQEVTVNIENLEISNSILEPVYVADAKKVTLVIYGSVKLAHAGTEGADSEENTCIYSNSDLAIDGGGKLSVVSNRAFGIVSTKTLLLNDASVSVESRFDSIRSGTRLVVNSSDISVNSRRDGLVTIDSGLNSDGLRQGEIVINNSKLTVRSLYWGINASSTVRVTGGFTSVDVIVPYDDSDGAGIVGADAVIIEGGEINISAPSSGILVREQVLFDNGDMSAGSFAMFDGFLHVNTSGSGIKAGSTAAVYGGIIELFDSKFGISSANTIISGGNITCVVEFEALKSEEQIHMTGGNVNARVSGDMTPTKSTEFIQEGGSVLLETNNPNAVFGAPEKCYFMGGSFVCFGETFALPDNSSAALSVVFSNASIKPGKTYVLSSDSADLLNYLVRYAQYSSGFIASDKLQLNGKYTLKCVEEPEFTLTWTQNAKVTDASPKA